MKTTFLNIGIQAAPSSAGTSDHAALTSNLAWTSSGHTGTAIQIAGFDGGGAPAVYTAAGVLDLLLTTRGDLAIRGASTTGRVAVGAANYLLLSDGTDPAWASPASVRAALSLVVGTNVQAWDADLDGLAGLGDGIPVRSGGTWSASTADAVVSDAAGGNGLVTRTSSGSITARTIIAGSGVSVSNGDGVSGNPTITVSGGTNSDLDPTDGWMVDIQPAGNTVASRDASITVRSASAYNNTAALRRTRFTGSGVAMDWYFSANVRMEQNPTLKVRLFTGSSIASVTRYKLGVGVGGFTNTDVESATPYILVRASTGLGDTTWKVVTCDGTTATTTDTTVAFAAATEYLFTIAMTSGSVTVTINGVSTVVTATLPLASTDFTFCQCGLLGSTSSREWFFVGARLLVDYP